jgi:hypothetical protein
MTFDQPMFLVVVDSADGPYIPETDIAETSLVQVSKDILAGQYTSKFTSILAVLEINITARTCREVTDDFKDLVPKTTFD